MCELSCIPAEVWSSPGSCWSLKPCPQRLLTRLHCLMPFCISSSVFGAPRLIFFLPTSQSPECVPLPAAQRDQQCNHQINLKNSSREALLSPLLLTKLSAPCLNEGGPCEAQSLQRLQATLMFKWSLSCCVVSFVESLHMVHLWCLST